MSESLTVTPDISTAAAPAKVERKLLERDIQKQCVDWARAKGYWARKFSSMTQRSVPDYLFAIRVETAPMGNIKIAVEFKRPGEVPTAAQKDEIQAMVDAGWLVLVCDNFEMFKYEFERLEKIHRMSRAST